MKFAIQKNEIVDVLSKIQGLTGRRSSLAITECVLITAAEEGIQVIATDLETGYEGNFPANVEMPGAIAISARKFFEIVREDQDDVGCFRQIVAPAGKKHRKKEKSE